MFGNVPHITVGIIRQIPDNDDIEHMNLLVASYLQQKGSEDNDGLSAARTVRALALSGRAPRVRPECQRAPWPLRVCHALLLLLAWLSPAWADVELVVSVPSAHPHAATELGTVDIPAVGRVTVTAQWDGARVLLQATNPAGSIIGRAETVMGLQHTPLYLQTPAGLTRLLIRWQAS